MLDVGIKETTTTTGTGAVTLSAVPGFVRVSDAFGVGDPVSYCITSGNDREWGIGVVGAGNTMSRTEVIARLVSGVLTEDGATAINLTGTSEVVVTQHNASPAMAEPMVRTPVAAVHLSTILKAGVVGSTIGLTANRLYAMPFVAPAFCAPTGYGLVVTTAVAGTAYVGVADSVGTRAGGYKPGRLIGYGSMSVGTTGIKTDTASTPPPRLKPGHLYWMLLTCSSAATIRALASANLPPVLGLSSADALTPFTWIFASQAGPIPSDLSGITWVLPTSGLTAPHLFFTT